MHFTHAAIAILLSLSTTALADRSRHQKVDPRDASQFVIHIENRAGPGYYIGSTDNPNVPAGIINVGSGPLGSSAVGVYPAGWAGRITIGKSSDPAVLSRGSMIEASFINSFSSFDVSYVEGYSVPIVCSCQGTVVAGCNTALENTGIECPELGPADTCYNPLSGSDQAPGSQADPFFQPCQGNAMTYPQDYQPATIPHCDDSAIFCCVGSDCPSNKSQSQKRSLDDEIPPELDEEFFDDEIAEEQDPDLNPRDATEFEPYPDTEFTDGEWEEELDPRALEEDVFSGSYYYDSDNDDEEIEPRSFLDKYFHKTHHGANDDLLEDIDRYLIDRRDIPALASSEAVDQDNSETNPYTASENAHWEEAVEERSVEEEDTSNTYDSDDFVYDEDIKERSVNTDYFSDFNYNDPEYPDDELSQRSLLPSSSTPQTHAQKAAKQEQQVQKKEKESTRLRDEKR